MTGMMQEEMIKKAVRMDLICYDCDTYYDDFVVAAAQLEEMVVTAIIDLARMGFLINTVARFRIMKLEYDYDVKKKTIMRRANYSKRVFYQPEFAKEIKLSHIEVPLEKQFHQALDETLAVAKRYGIRISLWSFTDWVLVFTLLSAFCVPIYLGYLALVVCCIGLGDVAALNNAQGAVRDHLDSINYCVERVQKAGLFCDRFHRFMDYEGKIEESLGIAKIPQKRAELVIKDMSFRYDGAAKDTLKHINIRIKPGEKIALVGENGAGKSTFIKLLMRLYDVTEGSICYGGHDIREYTTKEYRDIFGAVFQDYQIYAASVEENVMMQRGSESDHKSAELALEQSGFSGQLGTLPNGLKTSLTREFAEDGINLSGGEAQKVAIARLFAKREKMHIAILDEPSSALDPKAEYELNKNMLNKAGDAAVILFLTGCLPQEMRTVSICLKMGKLLKKGLIGN